MDNVATFNQQPEKKDILNLTASTMVDSNIPANNVWFPERSGNVRFGFPEGSYLIPTKYANGNHMGTLWERSVFVGIMLFFCFKFCETTLLSYEDRSLLSMTLWFSWD